MLPIQQHFNSKLVQFKVKCFFRCYQYNNISIPNWYNSKRLPSSSYHSTYHYFNSKLVQFKEDSTITFPSFPVTFQFQTGTIQSLLASIVSYNATIFQFQTGTIQSRASTSRAITSTLISIPNWYNSKNNLKKD